MKFVEGNKALIILLTIVIFNFVNFIQSGKQIKKNKKDVYEDDFPSVAPLSPAAVIAVKNGNKFCSTNCVTNFAVRTKTCIFEKKAQDCKRCDINPKIKKDKSIKTICENLCNAILPSKPCNFYGYFNGKLKKNVAPALLNKFNLKLIRRK
jgi:hypothetical protein